MKSCSTCTHAAPVDGVAEAIDCRRFPPKLMLLPAPASIANPNAHAMTLTAMHPRLHVNHNCGEFSPREVH